MQSSVNITKLELPTRTGEHHKQLQQPGVTATFSAKHNNGTTSVNFPIALTKYEHAGWKAELVINVKDDKEFASQPTAGEAAAKLAEYLERMAIAIKENPDAFDNIDINAIKIK